ncbi:hypothetical protein GCK72_008174 [Caenorhabditis remanei]|uniref:Uncharacterized protein n=1 Tax=Caenorhabditis remanei TaxID=31234 RepID=A0A6A5GZ09_CAERE|nr:hypothetical protein GCK72_008174 [Caenorhabditis remanei]KAF1759929.1 hypothetical protein GCK72_008174 [Caenorhabditis remanei]
MKTGAIMGASRNAANYVIQVGGRSSNILNIFDKTSVSSLGNARWFARIDMPHGNVPYYHINVNQAITGVKDPHYRIWGVTAKAAGITGRVLSIVNKIAPAAMILSFAYDGYEILDDYQNGKIAESKRKVVAKASTYIGASYGAGTGASIGSIIFPGVGTLLGGLIGGVLGGMGGGIGGDVVASILVL